MKKNILYLTRNGILEPLGQSQVLSYLRGVSKYYNVTIISFEKDVDLKNINEVDKVRDDCAHHGILWMPQRFHTADNTAAAVLILVRFIVLACTVSQGKNMHLIHARSYIPALVALFVGRLLSIPYIFDMRGLWVEELITSGRINRESIIYRVLLRIERACLHHSAATITLTKASVSYLRNTYCDLISENKLKVIPTCADLRRFPMRQNSAQKRIIGCVGTIMSGWFLVNWLKNFIVVALSRDRELLFEITTRDDPIAVGAALRLDKEISSRVTIVSAEPTQIPLIIQKQLASVMFYAGGQISEVGRSPTRLAEILGTGVPVVANAGVGDIEQIILSHRVGVIVRGASEVELHDALDELVILLEDPGLSSRCRAVAEAYFSLEAGTQAYLEVYRSIISNQLVN
jgi:glycosyltransferase involved in cell wall biosynthesis